MIVMLQVIGSSSKNPENISDSIDVIFQARSFASLLKIYSFEEDEQTQEIPENSVITIDSSLAPRKKDKSSRNIKIAMGQANRNMLNLQIQRNFKNKKLNSNSIFIKPEGIFLNSYIKSQNIKNQSNYKNIQDLIDYTTHSTKSNGKTQDDFAQSREDFVKNRENCIQNREDFVKSREDFMRSQADCIQNRADFTKSREDFVKNRENCIQNRENFIQNRDDFVKSKEDFMRSQADCIQNRADFTKSREDFIKSRSDFAKSREDFIKSQSDFLKSDTTSNFKTKNSNYSKSNSCKIYNLVKYDTLENNSNSATKSTNYSIESRATSENTSSLKIQNLYIQKPNIVTQNFPPIQDCLKYKHGSNLEEQQCPKSTKNLFSFPEIDSIYDIVTPVKIQNYYNTQNSMEILEKEDKKLYQYNSFIDSKISRKNHIMGMISVTEITIDSEKS